jgi:hypothetical protein
VRAWQPGCAPHFNPDHGCGRSDFGSNRASEVRPVVSVFDDEAVKPCSRERTGFKGGGGGDLSDLAPATRCPRQRVHVNHSD